MTAGKLTLEKIIDFSNSLDHHILTSEFFFDAELLNLIEAHLGYTSSSFISYEFNRTYKSSVGHNVQMEEEYESYMPVDPFAKYITQNYDNLVAGGHLVVKSSSAFADYERCEFHDVLKTFNGTDYAAVMLFDNLRITVYKKGEDGDFSDEEVRLLQIVDRVISSRYALFSGIADPSHDRTLEEMKNRYFDTLSTGVIILDRNYKVLDSNKVGREYVSALAPSVPMSAYFANLIPLLNIPSSSADLEQVERAVKFDNFMISIRLYQDVSSGKLFPGSHTYFITITNGDHSSEEDTATSIDDRIKTFCERFNLSARELDIIIALSNGHKYQDIANELFISINTVRTHVRNIYRKLEIDNQRSLLYMYNQYVYKP